MPALTDSGTLVRMAYQGLRNLNIDADEVLRRSGLNPKKLYKPNLRTQFSAQPIFWQAAVELSGDPSIGLHLGEKMPVYKGQILEYLLLSSANFGDGLKRILNYQRLISDAMHGKLIDDSEPYLTNYYSDHQYLTPHLAESMVVSLIRFLRSVTDDKFQPKSICFTHSPNTNLSEYKRVFQCPVEFDCKQFKLFFDRNVLDYRCPYAEPELLSMHVRSADQHMQLLEKRDLITAVRSQVGALLESGDISLQTISNQLGISARQLRHQLHLAGTSLQKIINQHRKLLSKQLLTQTDESIDEIVYLTGFSEPSTFYRAFKRWEGMTPIAYRNQHQSDLQQNTTV